MNTVMAARSMTRRYDEQLRPFGVSVVQFAILATLARQFDEPVSRTAERVATDRTTLLRNLELLLKKGLVRAVPATRGNGRRFLLSEQGRRLVTEITPHWQMAQAELRELLAGHDHQDMLVALKKLTSG
ncbi:MULTISPECIES: MarR family winged helix-turn-helix transcriptional regulator [unclassified Nitratireductor]|uniref:MarR family winged helix-turn-helix transcriptional regulator n=1 Tax=unclassified Nitratireductor TaxID=2641084 RepID=UPI0025F35066|nr:MarR family winged helix-turn-helix transcriptional regulator [Nitratireductor sp.]